MSELQKQQFPIDRAIFAEVLGSIPPTWSRAKLEARVKGQSADHTQMAVRIDPLGQPGIAVPTDALQERVRELFLLNERFKTDLRGIAYTYTQTPEGRWSFSADYEYPE